MYARVTTPGGKEVWPRRLFLPYFAKDVLKWFLNLKFSFSVTNAQESTAYAGKRQNWI